ncbi:MULTISPECIES: hypoxanthine phosphoribosyltransferase [unclassified Lentimicrobium]|uniref:hypoxanthine phosphoribosyltransferase n=1 Tax=unclassified Lentimicrobium TaxID=2677434 RepID=UPI0015561920|nr:MULTISPECIES: hypoxanthine phosphoribosyltransferase [unclassified Lentimicrobium]NPD44270.1 hypoxanthine phosphoribosyltransferase [Lentimicrobium sp. S6]NPD86186.1 hypoxanthine phosphoribosyltransferase [Lentimicrobium sp. L6]
MEAKTVKLYDKEFKISIPANEIDQSISNVADKINVDYEGKNPLFIIVLNGAFMFASDLLKKIHIDCEITFVKLSSYVGTKSSHVVREVIGLDKSLAGRNVIVVEDIIDTGITMHDTLPKLKQMEAADVKIATLLFKPNAFQKDFPIDYIGMEIPNDFIVGYGLDYDGLGRNLADIYKIID